MEIKDVSVSSIIPYNNNPRDNRKALSAVINSIKTFGFRVPIVIDKNNVIICGHTRFEAAKSLKLESVPCVVAEGLSEEQVKAYRLADNRTQDNSSWDFEALQVEFDVLNELGIDLKVTGFDESEISSIMGMTEDVAEQFGEISYDDFSEDKFEYSCPCCGFRW